MREQVCHLQLLLAFASAVIFTAVKLCSTYLYLRPGSSWTPAIYKEPISSQLTICQSQSQSHTATDGGCVSQSLLVSSTHLRLMTRYLLLFDSYSLVIVGRPLKRTGLSFVRVIVCSSKSFVIM
jgi:hypothetical protein